MAARRDQGCCSYVDRHSGLRCAHAAGACSGFIAGIICLETGAFKADRVLTDATTVAGRCRAVSEVYEE